MSTNGHTHTVLAPAKVNLFLEVSGKRNNGYHDLSSVMTPISLFDELTFEVTDGDVETTVDCEEIPGCKTHALCDPQINCAQRAALILKEISGYKGGARIHILKRIPVCAGLGGGSSDAAATLRELNRLWRTGMTTEQLAALGMRIGSDVPALVYNRAVITGGLGEQVAPVPLEDSGRSAEWWVVVVNPWLPVSTGDIYRRYTSVLTSKPEQANNLTFAVTTGDMALAARNLFNSLEPTVYAKYPVLEMIAARLREAGAEGVLLCGSGGSILCLARDEVHARSISDAVAAGTGMALWRRIARVLPDGVTVAHGPLEARV